MTLTFDQIVDKIPAEWTAVEVKSYRGRNNKWTCILSKRPEGLADDEPDVELQVWDISPTAAVMAAIIKAKNGSIQPNLNFSKHSRDADGMTVHKD